MSMMTRFAPSPTGYLHLGHLWSAIFVWSIARKCHAKVCLRIEDHDRIRCRPEFEIAIYEDLRWLGFEWDFGPEPGVASSYRQSDCLADYKAALESLIEKGQIYACGCSRKEIEAAVGVVLKNQEVAYPGSCRDGRHSGWSRPGLGLRWRMPTGIVEFDDLALGRQTQVPAEQCGDLLIRDRDGNWTYQFAVVVDDLRHGIDLIVRGSDILSSTGRQILLEEALNGLKSKTFYHHPILNSKDGEKLSKKDGAKALRKWRQEGRSAEELIGIAVNGMGFAEDASPLSLADAVLMVSQRLGGSEYG